MKRDSSSKFSAFLFRVIIVHTITYILFGLVMSNLLGYERLFEQDIIKDFMLPINSRTLLGLVAQPVRGFLFAIALWPLREIFLVKRNGWLYIWLLFLVFGILSTTSAAPCSIEGVLYTRLPIWYHLIGLPEIILQTLLFSYLIVWWEKRQTRNANKSPEKEKRGFIYDLINAIALGCFSYIGFAVSSITAFFISGSDIDFNQAASDIKNQLMFVATFIANVIFVLVIKRVSTKNQIPLTGLFVIAWFLDSVVLFAYQTVFYGSSAIIMAALISLLPALILAYGITRSVYPPGQK